MVWTKFYKTDQNLELKSVGFVTIQILESQVIPIVSGNNKIRPHHSNMPSHKTPVSSVSSTNPKIGTLIHPTRNTIFLRSNLHCVAAAHRCIATNTTTCFPHQLCAVSARLAEASPGAPPSTFSSSFLTSANRHSITLEEKKQIDCKCSTIHMFKSNENQITSPACIRNEDI